MSLPWRHSSVKEYVADTLFKLQSSSSSSSSSSSNSNFTHLKIGNFFLHHPLDDTVGGDLNSSNNNNNNSNSNGGLQNSDMIDILTTAQRNSNISELTFCGVFLDEAVATALVGLLASYKRTLINCESDTDDKSNKKSTTSSDTTSVSALLSNKNDASSHEEENEEHLRFDSLPQEEWQTRKWKKIAMTSCRGMGVMALAMPPTHTIQSISIEKCQLSRHDFWSLGMILKFTNALTTLELIEETIEHPHATSLSEGLKQNSTLRSLEFSYCQFLSLNDNGTIWMEEGRPDPTIIALACGIQQNKSLEILSFPGCELEDDDIAEIVSKMSDHEYLQQLKFFRNRCGTKTNHALELFLSKSSSSKCTIQHQNENYNNQSHNSKLTEKMKQQSNPGSTSNCIPCSAPRSTMCGVFKLDLSYQHAERTTKLNIEFLAISLPRNSTLNVLCLAFNRLTDDDAITLSQGLARNKFLQELDLRANNIRNDGVTALAQVFQATRLRKVYLFGNPFTDSGASALCQAIRENTDLIILNMDYKSCFYDEIQYFACLNYGGRRLLKDDNPNFSLWPLVLARADAASRVSRGICSGRDIIYHLVRGRPTLFHEL